MGRDHACEVCHRGGMNDPGGSCDCDPRAVLVAETLVRCEGFEPHPGDIENWIDHATAVVKALDAADTPHRERLEDDFAKTRALLYDALGTIRKIAEEAEKARQPLVGIMHGPEIRSYPADPGEAHRRVCTILALTRDALIPTEGGVDA